MKSNWSLKRLDEVINFNPPEILKSGTIAKKIAMEKLKPYDKEIKGYEVGVFQSGAKFRNGDTLVAKITPCLENGKTAKVDILEEDEVAFGSTEFIVLRENEKSINDFIFYLAISPIFRKKAVSCMEGTSGRKRVNENSLKEQEILFPEIDTQKKIIAILNSLDDKISLNNRINSELEQMAKTIYNYWFVQFDFPTSAAQAATAGKPKLKSKPYKTSGGEMVWNEELKREVPVGWEVKRIGDVLHIVRGASPRPIDDYLSASGMPWVKISDATATDNRFITETKQFIIKEGITSSRLLPIDTLILSNSATPAIPRITKIEACVHDGWLIIDKYSHGLTKEFMFHYFEYERPRIINFGSGSIFKNLKTDYIKDLNILLPTETLLRELTPKLKTISDTIYFKTIENQELTHLRDFLLPLLMNGQVRVDII